MKIRLFTIPNILTLCNLMCGLIAVRYVIAENNLTIAFYLVIAAAIFDFFDGFVARLLKSHSAVGKELDSLADVVSFGVVPAAVAYSVLTTIGAPIYLSLFATLIALFSALRLAKFNIDENQTSEFIGMPTPANALFFTSAGWLLENDVIMIENAWMAVGVVVIMSWLLISPVRMFALKFKNYALKDNKLRYGFVFGSIIGIVCCGIAAIPVIIIAYIAISTISHFACRR